MTMTEPYPVIEERRLPAAAPGRLFARRRRELSELPPSPPGTALVFQAEGRFKVFDEQQHLTGTEDFVLDALSVAVVKVRPHKVFADLQLPSAHHSEPFAVRVTFKATVTRPELVVRQGAFDLAEDLGQHLRKDPRLAEICAAHRIEQLADVRVLIDARISAYYAYRGYNQPGIDIELVLVEVLTPKELEERDRRERTVVLDYQLQQQVEDLEQGKRRQLLENEQAINRRVSELEHDHAESTELRERRHAAERAEWEHRERRLEQQRNALIREKEMLLEDAAAKRNQAYLDEGVDSLLALAQAQGKISPLELARLKRDDRIRLDERRWDAIKTLMNGDNGDLLSADPQPLIDALMADLTGPTDTAVLSAGAGAADRADRALAANRYDSDLDLNPPDEDDFHG
ncbi:MAG TPA: hypothetical protein VGX23_04490 [Actinocrinis sp.]|nr:hypothetical protein [Actinocrinis sp.]